MKKSWRRISSIPLKALWAPVETEPTTEAETEPATQPETEPETTPPTGDSSAAPIWAAALLLSVCAAAFVLRKRSSAER